jgi:multiple antibiotic resistance protein
MLQFIISFLVLLNPFALFMYLNPIAAELNERDFFKLLLKAGGLSLLIFLAASLYGKIIFDNILFVDFASFKIFGGIVIITYALIFIIQGKKSFFTLKGDLDDLAAEISLPFMVGAATISLCLIIGNNFTSFETGMIITITMIMHVGIVFSLHFFKCRLLKERLKVPFDKIMGMLLRLNGFIVGAIGSNLITSGIRDFFTPMMQ